MNEYGYCGHCGRPMRVTSRKPYYNPETGKKLGYFIETSCSSLRWWKIFPPIHYHAIHTHIEKIEDRN